MRECFSNQSVYQTNMNKAYRDREFVDHFLAGKKDSHPSQEQSTAWDSCEDLYSRKQNKGE